MPKFYTNASGKFLKTAGGVLLQAPANPLCFTAEQDNSSVGYTVLGTVDTSGIQKSTDKVNWVAWDGTAVALNTGDKFYVRNTNNTLSTSGSNCFNFTMTGLIAASGNCNSMINYAALSNYCFYNLFKSCASLTKAPVLPATTLAIYCYAYMFYDCANLVTAPNLPATSLAVACYRNMFYQCTSLAEAPNLPATSLAYWCYAYMFYQCTSLTQAPELPATTLADYCYTSMFEGCTSLTEAPILPATTLATYCYGQMFIGCTSLTEAPELPATTLASDCYHYMFQNCTSLTTVPMLSIVELKQQCYYGMFSGCTSLQVSDTQTSAAQYAWRIPSSGTFTNTTTYNQSFMFKNCLGTRSSDSMSGALGESHVYYTQNQPV